MLQYARLEDARSAQAALNGSLELAGRVIKVCFVYVVLGMVVEISICVWIGTI